MNINKKIINTVFILPLAMFWACLPSNAQNEVVRSRYNESIEGIVKDVIQAKSGYPELENFSKTAISQGVNGFENISYVHDLPASGSHDPYAYRFSVGIKDLSSDDTKDIDSSWEVKFPLLGFKVVAESERKGESVSFDFRKIVEKNLANLRVLEQDFLPFRLELKTEKDVYSVREEIVLTVSLKNMSPKPYKLADLDENSLYCTISDQEWGNSDAQVELNKVLNSNGMIQQILTINGMETPQEIWIACTYAVGYKGVQPYSRAKISIQPKR